MASKNWVSPHRQSNNGLAFGFGLMLIGVIGAASLVLLVWMEQVVSPGAPERPSIRRVARITLEANTSAMPTSVRGFQFNPGEAIELSFKPSVDAPFVRFVKLGGSMADGEGNFVAALPAAQLTAGGYVIAKGASSGWTLPVGPLAIEQRAVASSLEISPLVAAIPTTPAPPTPAVLPTPTAVLWPTPLPDTNPIGQWYGEYFANRDLQYSPVVTRNDAFLDFNWSNSAPSQMLPRDNFSARWVRREMFDQTENYQFTLVVDDGARVYFDDQLIINEWRIGPRRTVKASVPVVRGEHSLRVEYYSATGNAFISLDWRVAYSGWEGRYYNSTDFTGDVLVKRDEGNADGTLDVNWGEGGVGYGLNNDNFSVNWERRMLFRAAGEYRFNLEADDGARVYIDGVLLFDNLNGPGAFEARRTIGRGWRFMQVQYVERSGQARIKLTWQPVAPEAEPAP